jgi:hypothetical protein
VLLAGCGFQHGELASPDGSIPPSESDGAVQPPDATTSPVDAATDAFVGAVRQINIEGGAFTGIDHPGVWAADLGVCPGATTLATTDPIAQTADDVLFQSAAVANHVHCMLGSLPAGTYTVTLLFGELTCGSPQTSRVFSVSLEGSVVVPSFDLLAESGGCETAIERTYSTVISDGVLDVDLGHLSGEQPLLSAARAIQTGP